jgi:prolyl oligopeptidase
MAVASRPAAASTPRVPPAIARPAAAVTYPPTPREDRFDNLHGVRIADPYRWLEDGHSADVKKWVDDQDAMARSYLSRLPGRGAMRERLQELLYAETENVPRHYGHRWFFAKRDAGKEKFTVYFRDGKAGKDKVLLDPNTWSADGSVALGVWSVSWDGRFVAYTTKPNNSDEATLSVMDVATGRKNSVDVIEGAKYAYPSWTPSGDGFFYTWVPAPGAVPVADRPGYAEVRFHKLGVDPRKDEVVHERTGDPKTFIRAVLSRDGRWLVLTIPHGWARTDVYVKDLRSKERAWRPLTVGRDAIYNVAVDRNHFWVHTNEDAPNYRVLRVDATNLERSKWTEIVPERQAATLQGCSSVGHHLLLWYLKDVISEAELRDSDGRLVRALELPRLGSIVSSSGNVDDDLVYYAFQSFTYPTEIFETSVTRNMTRTWSTQKVPIDPSQYQADQLFATSKDGTRVPFFVVHGKGLTRNGAAPTILYAYGGFEVSQTSTFSPWIFPWLERGGIWVVANLRGGGEYGETWHRRGMRREKQNVFDDYIAVAEELVRQGFTRAHKLAARGLSNGGLLVGAAITQRPDLFGVALCGVPLLDMVRYQQFGSGQTWIEEYGSADDADDFAALFAYSPYHHIVKGTKYPAMLLLGADTDDRVDPMHARKFAAALQWASTGPPALLRIERNSGHQGADLVRTTVEKLVDEYAFALDAMRD